ncbi:PAS domain-containing protein [Flavobacterium psychrotolerans]|uniref:PAS domain S-box protein n=1 Tax=Flavobacterium psychrotolerans TaxID=2169410 RepID=A0A2U1JN53_9FLAO|nr:PAS domain-containing protein [Flavobacterium psychrotolerans]PWA06590.1 hypothetical protein DB895_04025 [Flavobacterium psychrotolerans]
MKISFETKIFLGFIINLLVVIASGWIFISLLDSQNDQKLNSKLNWIELSMFGLSIVLLFIVYFIIRSQLRAKNISQNLLSENKRLLQSIIDNTSNPIFIKEINGEYLLINKKYESLFHISNEEIIGKTDHDFLPKEIADAYRDSDLEVVKALKELKTEEIIQESDGSHTYIAVKFPLYDFEGRIYAIGGISTDITERKKLEESLVGISRLFKMSLDIMVIASGDRFIKVNPSMSKILGYTEEELLSQPFFSFIYPDDYEITKKEVAKLQMGAITIQFEIRWVCKDKSIKWLSWSSAADISTGFLYGVARDVTEQKEIQKTLAVAEKFFAMSNDLFGVIKLGYFSKINPAFTRILGYKQEEINDKTLMSFAHPDEIHIFSDTVKKLQEGETVVNYRARAHCKDGSYKWLDWTNTIDIPTGIVYAAARDVTLLVESEESVKMANNFYNMSFDILVVGKGDRFIKVNPAYTKTFGYTQKEIDSISIFSLSSDPERAKEAVGKLAKGEPLVNFTDYVICKDGSYKWVNWNATVDLKTGLMYGVARDITQLKADEEKLNLYTQKLQENDQQVQTILDGAPEPVIVIDSESVIQRWNPRAETVFGWNKDEVVGKHLFDFIVPERYREPHKNGMQHFLTTGIGPILNKSMEIEAVNKKGIEFPVSLSISPVKMDGHYIFIGFVRDITESKKAVDELYENEETLRLIIENIGEGVLVANSDKKVVMANNMANEIYGIEEDNQIAASLSDHFELYFPDERTVFPSQNLPMERALNGETTDDVDLVLWNPVAKEKKRVLISGRPLIDQNEKVVAAVVTIKDISKYKQLEEELKETESKYRQLIGFKSGENKQV